MNLEQQIDLIDFKLDFAKSHFHEEIKIYDFKPFVSY